MTGGAPLPKPTLKSALRDYAGVTLALAASDVLLAFWLAEQEPLGQRAAAFVLYSLGAWFVTALMWVAFAAKHLWWTRRQVAKHAAAIVEMNDGRVNYQHATDLLTCPGPCQNPYGCMVGICVQAALRRDRKEVV